MTIQRTLASLKEALQQPFAPETIQFLPKEIRTENGRSVCVALPYANKRIYEDRLNALVFGEWSTPPTQPYAQGNKLIIPVTVIILGVAHTDYGEAFLLASGKNGNTREDENTATEAYSQAFRRACAKFLLGRYLYDLPKYTLPYDPKTRQIAISKAERIAWVEKLYMERGLMPRIISTPQRPVAPTVSETSAVQLQTHPAPPPEPSQPSTPPIASPKTSLVQQPTPSHLAATVSLPLQPPPSAGKEESAQPTAYQDTFLDWVAQQVGRDPQRIQGICTFYQVQELAKLSRGQRKELTRRLRQQASQQRQSASAATASV